MTRKNVNQSTVSYFLLMMDMDRDKEDHKRKAEMDQVLHGWSAATLIRILEEIDKAYENKEKK